MGQANLPEPDRSFANRHRFAMAEVKEIVGRIWKWVLLGIGVGALFHGFVPEQWVSENLGGDAWYTVPAAVLMGIMPISTFVLAHLFIPAEPMTARKLVGVLTGFGGLIALVGMSALGAVGSEPLGQLAVLAGAFCYSLSAVYVRRRGMAGSIEAATGVGIVAAMASVPLAFWLEDPTTMQPSVGAVWSTLALGAIHTAVAALIYFRTIRSLGAMTFAQINYLIPVLGSIWGVLLLGESLGWRVILALALVLAGIYFVQPRRTSRPVAQS